MKKVMIFLAVCVVGFIFLMLFSWALNGFRLPRPELEVGQIWEDGPYRTQDPFKSIVRARFKIIALEYGTYRDKHTLYVKYERLDGGVKGARGSMREAVFRAGDARLVGTIGERLRAAKLTIGGLALDETIFTDDKGWSSHVTILADENNEGGLQFYIGKETGRLQVVMDGNTDMNEAAEIFFDNMLKPMVDEYIEKRLKQ